MCNRRQLAPARLQTLHPHTLVQQPPSRPLRTGAAPACKHTRCTATHLVQQPHQSPLRIRAARVRVQHRPLFARRRRLQRSRMVHCAQAVLHCNARCLQFVQKRSGGARGCERGRARRCGAEQRQRAERCSWRRPAQRRAAAPITRRPAKARCQHPLLCTWVAEERLRPLGCDLDPTSLDHHV